MLRLTRLSLRIHSQVFSSSMQPHWNLASSQPAACTGSTKWGEAGFSKGIIVAEPSVLVKAILWVLLHFRFESAVVQYFLPGCMLDKSNSTRSFCRAIHSSFSKAAVVTKRKTKKTIKNVSFSWIEVYRGTDLSHSRHKCRPFVYPAVATSYFSWIRLVWARATPVCSFTVVRSTSRWKPSSHLVIIRR